MARKQSTVTRKQRQISLNTVRSQVHNDCYVCSSTNNSGLSLEFTPSKDGEVEASFTCDNRFQGYPGYVHGGVVSSLLDGAMTNCMFALGLTPLTAELKVRFRHPLLISQPATVRAWLNHHTPPLYTLEAEIVQENLIKACAWGKFLDRFDP